MSTHLPTADLRDPDSAARTARLRDALRAAGFTADGLLELLGAPAYAALARSETVPALRATRGTDAPATLVRLFLLQRPVPYDRAAAALPVEDCLADGWLVRDGDEVRASVDVRPYGGPDGQDWWIVSDLGCAVGGAGGIRAAEEAAGVDRAQLVLGVGGASTTLAGITVRTPVAKALDLGTGSGIQALHASAYATQVTATDLNPRALRIARLTLALSGAPEADLREGSLFEPVGEETYDLIVSNPPFVISPGARLTYRDGGMGGDDLCRTLVQQAAAHLNDGGYCQLLANWQHVEGEDWRDRLRSWVPRGCDAWIVQREVQDVTQYAELWLRDAGDHRTSPEEYAARYDAWLEEFEARKTKAVGFGWITLRKSGAEAPRSPSRSGRTRSSSRWAPRSSTISPARTTCARRTTRRCWPRTSGSLPRSCRSRSGCPARRTRSMSSSGRTAACGAPRRWTRSARASPGCATARCPPVASWTRSRN